MKRVVAVLIMCALCLVAPMPTASADFAERIAAADEYLSTRPGTVGYVVRDRTTGAAHRNEAAGALIWTASTIKLAMVVDLLTRATAGQITMTAEDRQLMVDMLRSSDSDAADTLWKKFGGTDHMAFNRNFPSYGLTGLQPQQGYGEVYPDWGFQKATTDDLDRLMNYVLGRMPAAQTAAIVSEMQQVSSNQRWGVWGAGRDMSPGNKNGWSPEEGGWVVNSVGFAGPGQQYTLAIMNSLDGEGGFEDGVETTTRLAEILLST
jgi:hypothetical protein